MASRTPSAARTSAAQAKPLSDAEVLAVAAKLAQFIEAEAVAHMYATKDDGPMAGKPRPGVYCGGKIVVDGVRYQVGLNVTPLNARPV